MEVERYQPEDHFSAKFSIHSMTPNDFRPKQKLPIKLLKLEDTEELVVTRCKLRPSILLLTDLSKYSDLTKQLKQLGKKSFEEESVAVIPLYTVLKGDDDTGFPAAMAARIKALMYNQFFYCPSTKDSGLRNDSIARLDRLFLIRPIYPAFQPTDRALSEDALAVLTAMLRLMLKLSMRDEEYKLYQAFRELALETLPPSASIQESSFGQ
jgi:hypothetical protein